MRINNTFKFIIAIVICEIVGIGGAFFTSPAVSSRWYASLEKPLFQPPSWIFSPVWILLYALMGISLFLVWSSYVKASEGREKQHSYILPPSHEATDGQGKNVRMLWMWKIGIAAFFAQLFLNAVWSIIFFGLKSPGLALVDIALLWLAIVWTMVVFYKISRPAAYLFVPYLLWVSFAMYLNFAIWALN